VREGREKAREVCVNGEAGQLPPHTHSTNDGDDGWARMDGPVRVSKGLSTGGMSTERIASREGEQKKGEAKKVEQ